MNLERCLGEYASACAPVHVLCLETHVHEADAAVLEESAQCFCAKPVLPVRSAASFAGLWPCLRALAVLLRCAVPFERFVTPWCWTSSVP